jgi:uncharacterized damage-inducible protein DinB
MIHPPVAGTYAPYYEPYIGLVAVRDPMKLMQSSILDFKALLSEVPDEKEDYAYAPGKWTIKELAIHVVDCERIFATRALCIARGEQVSLPGFEEDDYAKMSNAAGRSLYDIIHEFGTVREASIALYKSFNEEQLDRVGMANNQPVTPRAILYIILGHQFHHANILRSKYGME